MCYYSGMIKAQQSSAAISVLTPGYPEPRLLKGPPASQKSVHAALTDAAVPRAHSRWSQRNARAQESLKHLIAYLAEGKSLVKLVRTIFLVTWQAKPYNVCFSRV